MNANYFFIFNYYLFFIISFFKSKFHFFKNFYILLKPIYIYVRT